MCLDDRISNNNLLVSRAPLLIQGLTLPKKIFSQNHEIYYFLEDNIPRNEYEAVIDRFSFAKLAQGLIAIEHHVNEACTGWIQIYDDGSISYDDNAKTIIADFIRDFDFSPELYSSPLPF